MDETGRESQHGCSLTNLAACVCVPAGIWIGFQYGLSLGGLVWGSAGAIAGALLAVPATLVVVVALVALAQGGHWLSRRIESLARRRE